MLGLPRSHPAAMAQLVELFMQPTTKTLRFKKEVLSFDPWQGFCTFRLNMLRIQTWKLVRKKDQKWVDVAGSFAKHQDPSGVN